RSSVAMEEVTAASSAGVTLPDTRQPPSTKAGSFTARFVCMPRSPGHLRLPYGPATQCFVCRRRLGIGDEVAARAGREPFGRYRVPEKGVAFPWRAHLRIADDMTSGEGFKIKTYASALDFLSDGEAKEAGCVVSDVRMPGMDGVEFLSHPSVRSLGLPVVLITAYATVPLAVRAMKLGAADFL